MRCSQRAVAVLLLSEDEFRCKTITEKKLCIHINFIIWVDHTTLWATAELQQEFFNPCRAEMIHILCCFEMRV